MNKRNLKEILTIIFLILIANSTFAQKNELREAIVEKSSTFVNNRKIVNSLNTDVYVKRNIY